jgi:hypothetical protein
MQIFGGLTLKEKYYRYGIPKVCHTIDDFTGKNGAIFSWPIGSISLKHFLKE